MIRAHSLSDEGKSLISPGLFADDVSLIDKRASYIEEIVSVLESQEKEPLSAFPSVFDVVDYAESTHRAISGEGLYRVGEYISSYLGVLAFLSKDESNGDRELKSLFREISISLDDKGNVKDSHPRIAPLLKELENIKKRRKSFSESYISENRDSVQNDVPVFRNGRVLIQMKSTVSKKGIYISGLSNTSQSIYAEPFLLVDLNNSVRVQEDLIESEKMKIISELSDLFRGHIGYFKRVTEFVGDFDMHYSFAFHILKDRWNRVTFSNEIRLKNLRHPLLGEKAVGLDFKSDEKIALVVFSGANGGGKTVSMKSLAVLSFLSSSIGFGPVDELSTIPLFDNILTDIGDGQSILKESSTFSSHMMNISDILRSVTPSTLVLLDELCSGTDPEEGSSLSLSIAKYLKERAGLTLITSHYSSLKSMAYIESDMLNASMSFDSSENRPLFRIIEGIPGESHALEAAERYGMPKCIVDEAKFSLSSSSTILSGLIASLEDKESELKIEIEKLENERGLLSKDRKRLEIEKERLELMQRTLSSDYERELGALIREKRSEIENLIKRIGLKDPSDKENAKKVRENIHELERFRESVNKRQKQSKRKSNTNFQKGERVHYGGASGTLLEGGRGDLETLFDNGIKMRVDSSYLKRLESERSKAFYEYTSPVKARPFIDVRGKSLEEAIRALDDQIESAILSSLGEFYVIHGLGNGILMKGIHQHLKSLNSVKDYYFAKEGDGGMGKTYVILK